MLDVHVPHKIEHTWTDFFIHMASICLGLLQDRGAYTWVRMRRFASFVAIFILLSAAAPVLACMTGSAMNQQERACCRAMHEQAGHDHCGGMVRMSCCQTAAPTGRHPQRAATAPSTEIHFDRIAWVESLFTPIQDQTVPPALLRMPDDHSPPGLITARTTVLRI